MKVIKNIICLILIITLFATMASPAYASTPDTSAPIAVVMDFYTGEILYERNMEQRWIPASMTKSMTAFIVYQEIEAGNLTLDTEIRVSAGASRFSNRRSVPGTFVPLPSGGLVTVETLLRLMMIPSGNAAAVVFAEHISGTEENFVIRMNETAAEMGMYTEFTNSHGAFVHYSNAYSTAILVREFIMRYPDILRITAMSSVRFQGRTYRNTNLLISQNMMADADGFKTGSLRQAGWNHSATAERDGRRIITVVMNTSSRSARQIESRRLLNYGFEELQRRETERIERARIFFNGGLIPLTEAPTFFHGSLLLPLEDILGQLGYLINRDEEHSLISITNENGYTATLLTGRDLAVINGETHTLSMPAQVVNDIIYTSIETIGALTGTLAEWSMETGVIRFRN
ncbi:MAG: serine hydrolase [Oscillospiraceae bacterium]|nr:serine hydrolase [Oscillospiraceae bacterium]